MRKKTAALLGVLSWTTAMALEAPSAVAQSTSTRTADVLDGIVAVDPPAKSFIPKYQPELFVGAGYSGSFTSGARQWPTLVVSPVEGLLARPGSFDRR